MKELRNQGDEVARKILGKGGMERGPGGRDFEDFMELVHSVRGVVWDVPENVCVRYM